MTSRHTSARTPAAQTTAAGPTDEPTVIERAQTLAARVKALKPVRVILNFVEHRGNLLASGLAYLSLFAVFAGLWVGFTIAGFIISANPAVEDQLLDILSTSVPGLLGEHGLVDPDTLTAPQSLSWTGAVALVGLIVTALAWLAGMRKAVRSVFSLPQPHTNGLLLKVKDLGIAIALAVLLLISAGLSAFSTAALHMVLGWVGIGQTSVIAALGTRAVSIAVMFALDTVIFMALYRVLAGVHIALRQLITGSLIGAGAMAVLKLLGTALLGGASKNPLLASFAVLIGLLIWFDLISRVVLFVASWIAVSLDDAGIAVRRYTSEELAEREHRARLLVAEADVNKAHQKLADARGLRRLRARRRVKKTTKRLESVQRE